MDKFTIHKGKAVAIDRANVDTDQIIPKQFLKRIERTGYGEFLFYDWRIDPNGDPINSFELNHPSSNGASILIAGPNFGCGSSREHAAWSLLDYGFRAIIAPSFGDIFYNNSLNNGLLVVRQPRVVIESFVQRSLTETGLELSIDLEGQTITDDTGMKFDFEVDSFRKHCLLNGLDDIALTMIHGAQIDDFESKRGVISFTYPNVA
jgi:3-isopropylmalate/(R)-2-methylmalate dehydratase small subunit